MERGFEEVAKRLHVEIDRAVEPFLVLFAGQSADEAQAALVVWEDADDVGAAFDFLVEAFEEVGAFDVFVVFARLAVEGPGLLDVFFDPGAELGVFWRPVVEPAAEVLACFCGVAAVVEPAQFGEAIVVGFAREMVEGVAQKVDVAALPCGLGEDFCDGTFEAGMVAGNGEAHAAQAALLEAEDELTPARGAFTTGQLHAEDAAAALPINADGHEHSARADDAILAHLLVARIEDEVRVFAFESLTGELFQLIIHRLVQFADGAGAELMAAKLLTDGLDFASGNALHIHLHQC